MSVLLAIVTMPNHVCHVTPSPLPLLSSQLAYTHDFSTDYDSFYSSYSVLDQVRRWGERFSDSPGRRRGGNGGRRQDNRQIGENWVNEPIN